MAEKNKPAGAEGKKRDKQKPDADTAIAADAVEPDKGNGPAEAGAPAAEGAAATTAEAKRKKGTRSVPSGIAYVHATFNNTKVTFTDMHGNVLCWSTGGRNQFKGSRKSTAYAAQVVAADAAKKAQGLGMKEVEIRIKGPGAGRESAVRGIAATGLTINTIKDITPVPHNGCRPPKRRRV